MSLTSPMGVPVPDTAPLLLPSLAGVSRSTTILVAYLMTVTELGWEGCLAATKAVRSYVSPNFGFQQQLQEYEATLLQEVRPTPASPSTGGYGVCKHARLFCMQLAAGHQLFARAHPCVCYLLPGDFGFCIKKKRSA